MKLRLKSNSLRLRLTQSEVHSLAAGNRVEDRTQFSPTSSLHYTLQTHPTLTAADFQNNTITITLPLSTVHTWATTDQVSIEAEHAISPGQILRLLIEKDFTCLNPRTPDEDADAFPNPAAAHSEPRP